MGGDGAFSNSDAARLCSQGDGTLDETLITHVKLHQHSGGHRGDDGCCVLLKESFPSRQRTQYVNITQP